MAVSQNQRLRKAAAKAAKRRAVVAEKLAEQRRELAISKPRHLDLRACPIVACTMTRDFERLGKGTLMIARRMTLGRFGVGLFYLDLWCLGIEGGYFEVFEAEDFEDYQAERGAGADPIDPADGLKLIRDCAAYGRANSFSTPPDFEETTQIFGDVAPSARHFTFGVEGKPYYVVPPQETPARVRRILETLEFNLGANGFQYEYPVEDEDGGIEGEPGAQ